MTNRKLKKRIRQAFTNATPDFAESLSVRSLLSDVTPRKRDEIPTKPIKSTKPDKTPIQFRALATLAASIAVVALLVGLLPKVNPLTPFDPLSSNPSPSTDCEFPFLTDPLDTEGPPVQGTDATTPTIDDQTALYAALDHAGITKDDIHDYDITPDLDDVIPHLDVTLYQTDYTYKYEIEYYYGEVLRVEKELTRDLSTNGASAAVIELNDAIRIATNDPLIDKGASVNNAFAAVNGNYTYYKVYFTNTIYWYRVDVSSSGWILKVKIANRNYHFSVDHDEYISTIYPVEGDTDRLTENQVLFGALNHAGLARDDVMGYTTSTSSADVVPHWDVTFHTADYAYEYEIGLYTGEIIKVERKYRQKLSDNDVLSSTVIPNDAAIEIAKNDPLMTDSTIVSTVAQGNNTGSYSMIYVRITGNTCVYEYEIASSYGIVTNLEITSIDYFDGFDDALAPPDGKIGDYNAIDAALRYAGLTFDDVENLECNIGTEDHWPQPHYDVTFYYNRCQWHYLIGMYNAELLSIEKIPLFD